MAIKTHVRLHPGALASLVPYQRKHARVFEMLRIKVDTNDQQP